jgi:hypothetical protein
MRVARRGQGAQPQEVVRIAAQGAGAVIQADFSLTGAAYPGEAPEVAGGADF